MSVGLAAQQRTNTARARVLVVDDHEEWRPLLEAVLSDEGYEVMLADSGEQALDLASSNKPDIVLLGLSQWQVNAVTVAEQVRRLEECETVPIILITAAEVGDCDHSAFPLMDGHINRSDVMSSLIGCLKSHLRTSGG